MSAFSVDGEQGGKHAKVLKKYFGVNLGQKIKQTSENLYLIESFINLLEFNHVIQEAVS